MSIFQDTRKDHAEWARIAKVTEPLNQEIAELKAKLAAAEKDAEKYQERREAERLIEDEMPEGYYIQMNCEPQNWYLSFYGPDDEEIEISNLDSTEGFIRAAVAKAKQLAAIAKEKE